MFGISSLGTNKDQLLHRIQSVQTIHKFTKILFFYLTVDENITIVETEVFKETMAHCNEREKDDEG